MSLWLSHPTGNTFVRALLAELNETHRDYQFFTSVAFLRRRFPVPPERLHSQPWRELARLLHERFFRTPPAPRSWCSADNVYRSLDANVAAHLRRAAMKPDAVYAYEDGALETFRAAASVGARRIYDLPIAYWKTAHHLLGEEAERHPAWEPTLLTTRESREKIERKSEELASADCVVCPSEFVRDSLPLETRLHQQCVISPFGSPRVPALSRTAPGPKLRLLFAGTLTQRKGLADLFAAMRILKRPDVELRVAGSPLLPLEFYRRHSPGFIYEKPRSHEAMLALMHASDVLVLPSIVEGRALVQQEALACGLPLIVTRNAGGEDLIEEGRTGFLVPIRSPESIAEKIDWFASHRNSLEDLRADCRRKAAEYSWPAYARRILAAVKQAEPDTASSAATPDAH